MSPGSRVAILTPVINSRGPKGSLKRTGNSLVFFQTEGATPRPNYFPFFSYKLFY